MKDAKKIIHVVVFCCTLLVFLQYANVLLLPQIFIITEIIANYVLSGYVLFLSGLGAVALILDYTHDSTYQKHWYTGVKHDLFKSEFKKECSFLKKIKAMSLCLDLLILLFGYLNGKMDALYISYVVSMTASVSIMLMYKVIFYVGNISMEDVVIRSLTDDKYNNIRKEYLAIKDSLIMDGAESCKEGRKELKKLAKEYYALII